MSLNNGVAVAGGGSRNFHDLLVGTLPPSSTSSSVTA